MKKLYLSFLGLLFSFSVLGQIGPGGIGNSDGSNGEPELKLWLLPDSLGLAEGNDVLTWTDYSGNSNDLSAVSATSPVFKALGVNGHDYLEFSKDNNRIVRNPFDMPADAVAVFMVIRTSDSGDGVLSYAVTGSYNEYLFYQSNSLTTHLSGSTDNSGVFYNDGSWKIFGHQWRSTDGRLYIHIDGTEEDNITFQSGATLTTGGNIAIGGEQDGVNSGYDIAQDFDGDIAELIMFGSSLKQADRVVIENYLAQKYGLDANLPQDNYVPDDASYIVALTGMGKESDGTTEASCDGLVITQNGGFNNGEYIMAAHDGTVNSINKTPGDVLHADIEARWERDWYLDKSGTVNAKIAFDFSEGINGEFPVNIENYRLLYKTTLGVSYDTIAVAGKGIQNGDQLYFSVNDADLLDGYYGLASVDTTNSPLDGVSGRSWYTLISGDWDDWEVWTLDPSGALPNNPDNLTPTTSLTSAADKVFILTGKTITVDSNNKAHNEITVDGRLDLKATTGHSFGTINGRGRILLSGDNFPAGDATDFITEGEGEGTVEYYGTSFNLNQSLEFYDLVIDMDDDAQKLTLLADYTINGNFRIKQGEFQINDNTATTNLNISVTGDVNVESNGKILTGDVDARHQLNLYGDFTNEGTAEFTNRGSATYTSEATNGIVDVNFLSGTKDQTVSCNGTSNFYRIEIDKGTDDTYKLVLQASNSSNFNLFGYANEDHGTTAQLAANNNALGLIKGTVQIKSNVSIPVLSTAGNYNISEAARLWVDGGTVQKNSGNSLVPYGAIQLSSGLLEAEVGSGITTRENGLIKVEGGTLNTNVIRTSVFGASNVGGYVQSGGTVNIVNPNSATNDYYHFSMTYPGNVFNMSGGTLHVYDASGTATGEGGIFIASDPENINVTGGTVIAEIASTTNPFKITSTAPFYNLILRNTLNSVTDHILDEGTNINRDATADLAAQPLVVLNDLTIEDDVFFDHDGNDVTIGGDFSISENAAQQGTNNYGYLFDATKPNTTAFNGSDDATFYIGHPDSEPDEYELHMNRLVLNKPAGKSLIVDSDEENNVYNVSADWKARILKLDSIKVESGILDQTDYAVRLTGSVINYDQIGVYEEGVNDEDALIMFAWAEYSVETSDDAIFGNVKLHVGDDQKISFSSDVHIQRLSFRNGRIYAGTHNLTIDNLAQELDPLVNRARFDWDQDGSIQSDEQGVYGPNDMIIFDGNASDGGLSLKITGNGSYTFPIGIGTDATELLHNTSKYTPAEVTISNYSDDGYITITPVDAELQTTDLTGGDILSYYWNVDYEGFTTEPTVVHKFYYYEADLDGSANENIFVPGKVLDGGAYTRSYENDNTQVSDAGTFDATGVLGKNPGTNGILNEILFNDHDNGGTGFTLENVNYTAGESDRFVGAPTIYYNRRNDTRNWDVNTSWYTTSGGTTNPPAGVYPLAGDIAVIRGNNFQDAIKVNGTQAAAEIVLQREGTYSDIEDIPRLFLSPTDVLNVGKITGLGELYLQQSLSNSATVNADIGEFAANDTSVVIFYMTQDGTYNVSETDLFTEFPVLRIYGQVAGYNRTASFNYDFKAKQLLVDGQANLLVGGNYTIENKTRLGYSGGGRIIFPNGTDSYRLKTGDFVTGRAKNYSDNDFQLTVQTGGGNNTDHFFDVEKDIDLNFADAFDEGTCTIDLFSTLSDNNVILHLSGAGNHTFSDNYSAGNSSVELYKIEMDKGTDTTSTFTFEDNFTLSGPTSGAGVDKAIDVQNGKLILNNAAINIDLTTGDDNFYIPSSAALEVRQGQANANGGSGILLDGKLQISGGTVDMSGGDNYIQYSASGSATIEVSGGTLTVGSQIRRGLSSTEGVLNYIQSGGEVIVGYDEAPENNRGVFEILNTGSNFTHTGGNLHIFRAQSNPSFASVYLDPETSTFGAGTALRLGYTNTPANQAIGIYSTVDIPNLVVDASSGTPPTAQQWTIPLTITDNLEIEAGATFDANGLDLILNGDFTVNGDFTPNDNTTYFSGTGSQQIVGSPVFWNLTKDATSTLTLNNNITVNNVLRHENGTISDGGNTLSVKGDVYFDGDHTWGGSGDGILLNGTEQQNLEGSGTYGKLSINNSEGIYVSVGNNIIIDDALQLENGIFHIGRNPLELNEDAIIIEQNAFSENNMIQTNISFTDAGVKKYFPAIVPADTCSFIYPMGSEGKYTPVEFDIDNVDAGGFIRVNAANEIHPTIINDTEPCNQIEDTANVLKYHWLLEATSITGFTADASMKYYPEDYQVPEAPYDVSAYIAARLLLNSTQWNKYDAASFDETNELLLFSFANSDDDGISGDYTAGVEDPGGSCEGAIPDEVPAYITINDGDWTNAAIWESYPTPGEYPVPSGGPRGAVAIVAHEVTIPSNYILSYKTQINSGGIVKVGSTFGHRLGIVEGTGTLQLERGDMPAGIYDDFFSRSGGTIEFAGSDDYDVLSEVTNVRNLKFSGTGERRLPNLDFEAYGIFTIDGTDATLEVINEHDAVITLDSNIVINQGSFEAGDVDAKVVLNGTSVQTISGTGDFTGTNAFWNLEMDNTAGVTLSTPVDIDNNLTFTNGIITTDATNILTIENLSQTAVTGYGSSNYVDGPLQKYMNSGDDFVFSVGDGGRYGPVTIYNTTNASSAYWEAEYFNTGYSDNTYAGNLDAVSTDEYWEITNPAAGDKAEVEIRWDSNSDITPLSTGNINEIVVAEYDGSDWVDKTSDNPSGDNYDGTVKTTNAISIDPKQYTLGSTTIIQAKAYFTTLDDVCQGTAIPVSFSGVDNTNNDFSLDYDYDDGSGAVNNTVTFSSIPYSLPTTDGAGEYTLTGFVYNVGSTNDAGTVDGSTVTVNPLPAQYNVTGGGSYCSGGSGVTVGLDGSEAGVNYELFVGTTSLGIYAGTGAALDFGNQTTGGTYTVEATDGTTSCTQSMALSATVTVYDLPAVTMTVNSAKDTICNGDNTEISLSFTAGAPNYDFTISDGTNTENLNSGGDNPYTYIPVTAPVWDPADGAASTITYTITYIEDTNGCTNTGDNTVDVVVYKVPETGNFFTPPNN